MAMRGRHETYYLASVILGYDKLTPHTHGPLCTWLDAEDSYRRLIQMPRSHFKTTIVTITKRIQTYLNNPGIRMLIVGNTAPNVRMHLKKIKRHFTSNTIFRWLYPNHIWEDTNQAIEWSQNAIYLPNDAMHGEPTIDTIGAAGEATSRHYDLINPDDLIGEEEYYSEAEMARVIEWFTGLESLFVPPIDEGQMDIPCTYWRTDDVYAYAEKYFGKGHDKVFTGPYSYTKGPLAVFRRSAEEQGMPIFPEAVSTEFLARLKENNPERYAAQYANNPYAADVAYFNPSYLRYYRWQVADEILRIDPTPDETQLVYVKDLWRIGVCDPHAGGSQGRFRSGGRAAVHMLGISRRTGRIFILDSWVRKAPTNKIIDEIIRMNEKWEPEDFSIEANGLQKMLRYWLDERIEREGRLSVPYVPYIPKGDKDGQRRIKGLQPLFRAGQIWMQHGFSELIEEYSAWPRGPKDGLDALAQVLEFWDGGWNDLTDDEMYDYEEEILAARNVATGY